MTTAFWHPFADMGAVSRRELTIERGEGVWVYDNEDNRYLDATASLWYANIGHARPEVADAVSAQMRHAKVRAATDHTTVGLVETAEDGRISIACACGMRLTNGPTWSLDEHIRLRRAEARFLALAAVAPEGIPRLVTWPVPQVGIPASSD